MSTPTSPEVTAAGIDATEILNTPNVVVQAIPAVSVGNAPEFQTNLLTGFWNALAVLAGAFSSVIVNNGTTWGKGRIFLQSSVANTYTVQVSPDNVNWYDLTENDTGSIFTLDAVAGHLNVARDLPGPIAAYTRLVAVGAATVTAGMMEYGI